MTITNNVFSLIGLAMFLDSFTVAGLKELMIVVETDIENDTMAIQEHMNVVDRLVMPDDYNIVREKIQDLFSNLRYNMFLRENILIRI